MRSMRKSKSKKLSKAKADKYFSLYIRHSNAVNGLCRCVTCSGMFSIDSIHCGHFMSRRYEATRYDEKNCAPQCVSCNSFHQGRQFRFGQEIDKRHGKGTAEKLEMKSKMLCKRNQFDYEQIAQEYKDKLNGL
jgi:hypothetical protein